MAPVFSPLTAGEKPNEPGWYVALIPDMEEAQIVRVKESYSAASEQILSVILTGSGNHYPLEKSNITFIARIYLS